ncbi:MAG: YidH family protein [Burkholderiaceae bacterium]
MSDDGPANVSSRFEVRTTADSHFAWLRTRLAVENTMLAYLRTAVSLIGFGFGVFQFVYRLQDSPSYGSPHFPDAAWYLGLLLIGSGVLTLVFAVREYRSLLRYLWSPSYAAVAGVRKEQKLTPLYAVTFVLILVGLFAFFAVLLRIG